MFYGEYQHTIDPKGRVFIPSKFRDGLGSKFILTKGFDECLFAYSKEEWDKLEAKLQGLPISSADARAFIRFFFSGATECEVDKQGRVLISPNLRAYAKLDKDVYILGVSSRVEIWDKARWEEYGSSENLSADNIAKKMEQLGF